MSEPVTAAADAQRLRSLRRARLGALSLLVLAALVDLAALLAQRHGVGGWAGYVRAGAEAGMVGGLADWFAVTALFRRPLGLPIPHTALVPTRKAALGESLADFVGTHFLAPDVVRDRIARAGVPRRVGAWLSAPEHAQRVTAEAAVGVQAAIGVLRDEDVRSVLGEAVLGRLAGAGSRRPRAGCSGRWCATGPTTAWSTSRRASLRGWLEANEELVVATLAAQAPGWSPRVLDEAIAVRAHRELLRVCRDVEHDRDHRLRGALDSFLARLAEDLRDDPATIERVEATKQALLERPDVRSALGDLLSAGRRLVVDLVGDPGSTLRVQAAEALSGFGRRLLDDEQAGRQGRAVGGRRGVVRRRHLARRGDRAHHRDDRAVGRRRGRAPHRACTWAATCSSSG
ncbi:hypothetical protein GCM10025868_44030 [Angustibacter aerolatus]|uniref:DUF445 domain-containing protein n=1 Tax=Angustibacter aerolatus TaxID=1162965 RepID=A0ABQ6JMA8_9ACTN|nr:DUF445 domain-containing protein [Angustibacter aerolatus]GMA89153.1 hypothetical protein GCM10025868_44030 [Angustibacter aerolatus]